MFVRSSLSRNEICRTRRQKYNYSKCRKSSLLTRRRQCRVAHRHHNNHTRVYARTNWSVPSTSSGKISRCWCGPMRCEICRALEPHYNPFILRDKPFVSPFLRIGFFHARVKSYNLILPLMCLRKYTEGGGNISPIPSESNKWLCHRWFY